MYRQIDIFDFIEKPVPLFEQLFPKLNHPLIPCANCLCHYCTHNAEELYDTVKLEEAAEPPCFICDECRSYTGNFTDREQACENCSGFIISDYGANRSRKRLKII